jgi:PPOX class probable F420-dependent enzyme
MIDLSTEFGQRVARRLAEEHTVWLTTVDSTGAPQPRPVWFLWKDGIFLIYSQPNAHKVSHIRRNPRVAVHLDTDGQGDDVVVFIGEASIPDDAPPADQVADYIDKYRQGLEELDTSPAEFASSYSAPIHVRPVKLRGF